MNFKADSVPAAERRQTQRITLPVPPPAPVVPEPISELRQEIADMHVQQLPTWQRQAAAFGHQVEDLAKRHPGTAMLTVFGVGMAIGTISLLLARRSEDPKKRVRRSISDLGTSLHDFIVPAANRAVQHSVDATTHGLHNASKGLDAAAHSHFLGRLRSMFA